MRDLHRGQRRSRRARRYHTPPHYLTPEQRGYGERKSAPPEPNRAWIVGSAVVPSGTGAPRDVDVVFTGAESVARDHARRWADANGHRGRRLDMHRIGRVLAWHAIENGETSVHLLGTDDLERVAGRQTLGRALRHYLRHTAWPAWAAGGVDVQDHLSPLVMAADSGRFDEVRAAMGDAYGRMMAGDDRVSVKGAGDVG